MPDTPSDRTAPTRSSHVRVEAGEAGQRIDNFLLRRAPGVPKSHVYRLIRQGDVRVDGRRVKPLRKLAEGEQVRVPAMRLVEQAAPRVPDALAASIAARVVLENDAFLVLDKPAGLAVHGGSGIAFGVIDVLRQALDTPQLELVHRLDRGTSGLLLVARDIGNCRVLQGLFRERAVEKRYLALVDGAWPADTRLIARRLSRNVEHAGERRVVVDPEGRSATSRFEILARFGDEATLVEVLIETGRTHQIRVHAASEAHAVIGDTRYGDNPRNTAFRQRGLARLCLHASRLVLPWQGADLTIEVPPDDEWRRMVEVLSGKS